MPALAVYPAGSNTRVTVVDASFVPGHPMGVRIGSGELHHLENTAITRIEPVDGVIIREHTPDRFPVPAEAMRAVERYGKGVQLLTHRVELRDTSASQCRDPKRVLRPQESVDPAP